MVNTLRTLSSYKIRFYKVTQRSPKIQGVKTQTKAYYFSIRLPVDGSGDLESRKLRGSPGLKAKKQQCWVGNFVLFFKRGFVEMIFLSFFLCF